jgi:hypothetical protein
MGNLLQPVWSHHLSGFGTWIGYEKDENRIRDAVSASIALRACAGAGRVPPL